MKNDENIWRNLNETDVSKLDLCRFLGGRSPYGKHDSSLENAFNLGKTLMQEIVRDRVGFNDGRVLDLLCGAGRWLPFLADTNREIVAIERIEDCMTLAHNMCTHFGFDNISFMSGDISRIEELEDSSFDFVWMWSGLQYVERAYALKQICRVLKPGGRVFVGAYNATGLMVEHVWKGAEEGRVFDGASQWALSALAKGPMSDGNPTFADIEHCEAICERFGLSLLAAAPQGYLDMRAPDSCLPEWREVRKVGAYFRTVEFLAERPAKGAGRDTAPTMRRSFTGTFRRLLKR